MKIKSAEGRENSTGKAETAYTKMQVLLVFPFPRLVASRAARSVGRASPCLQLPGLGTHRLEVLEALHSGVSLPRQSEQLEFRGKSQGSAEHIGTMADLSTRHPAVMSMSCGKQHEQSNHHFYRPVAEMLGLANLKKQYAPILPRLAGKLKQMQPLPSHARRRAQLPAYGALHPQIQRISSTRCTPTGEIRPDPAQISRCRWLFRVRRCTLPNSTFPISQVKPQTLELKCGLTHCIANSIVKAQSKVQNSPHILRLPRFLDGIYQNTWDRRDPCLLSGHF